MSWSWEGDRKRRAPYSSPLHYGIRFFNLHYSADSLTMPFVGSQTQLEDKSCWISCSLVSNLKVDLWEEKSSLILLHSAWLHILIVRSYIHLQSCRTGGKVHFVRIPYPGFRVEIREEGCFLLLDPRSFTQCGQTRNSINHLHTVSDIHIIYQLLITVTFLGQLPLWSRLIDDFFRTGHIHLVPSRSSRCLQ